MTTVEFGSETPFAEPYWYSGKLKSPYYNSSHALFRKKVRDFVEKELRPHAQEWNEKKDYPDDLLTTAYAAGVFACMWPDDIGGTPPVDENGKLVKFDAFHDLILNDEMARGPAPPPFGIVTMGLPPIIKLGSNRIKDMILPDVITGKKQIALCISEPWAGSDVANIRTTATRDPTGQFYLVNGEKKYITCGMKAKYFTVAVRTGEPGMFGISLLLIDAESAGVMRRPLKTQGGWWSPPAYISFENVKVPVENIIGNENEGFQAIMLNFNHERFVIAVGANRAARICIEEAINYARSRRTFGRRLIDHQVLRHKVSDMVGKVEAVHALLEQIAFQMEQNVPNLAIGSLCAVAKVMASQTFEFCAREASQIMGGASYLREGKGAVVEAAYREVRGTAIPGGSEEIMKDLGMKLSRL